jgi:hypothetical protein
MSPEPVVHKPTRLPADVPLEHTVCVFQGLDAMPYCPPPPYLGTDVIVLSFRGDRDFKRQSGVTIRSSDRERFPYILAELNIPRMMRAGKDLGRAARLEELVLWLHRFQNRQRLDVTRVPVYSWEATADYGVGCPVCAMELIRTKVPKLSWAQPGTGQFENTIYYRSGRKPYCPPADIRIYAPERKVTKAPTPDAEENTRNVLRLEKVWEQRRIDDLLRRTAGSGRTVLRILRNYPHLAAAFNRKFFRLYKATGLPPPTLDMELVKSLATIRNGRDLTRLAQSLKRRPDR